MKIKSKHGDFHLQGAKAYASTAEIGPCDLVMIALKATSNEALVELIPPPAHPTKKTNPHSD